MEKKNFPFEKMKKGLFYQVPNEDAKRIADRVFSLYDKDANRIISQREARGILRDVYKGIDPKRKIDPNELKEFYSLLDRNKDGKVTVEDFIVLVKDYFTNDYKKGAYNYAIMEPEIFTLNKKSENKNIPIKDIKRKLVSIGNKRYGDAFMKDQLKLCNRLFQENELDDNEKLEFNEIFKIFKHIYKKINFTNKSDQLSVEDLQRLLEMMNYDEDGKISFHEFELFYLKGLLGS